MRVLMVPNADRAASDGRADLIPQLTFPFHVQVIAQILGLAKTDWPASCS